MTILFAGGRGADTQNTEDSGAISTNMEIGGGVEWTAGKKIQAAFGGEASFLAPVLHPVNGLGLVSGNTYFQWRADKYTSPRIHVGIAGAAGLHDNPTSTAEPPLIRWGISYGFGILRGDRPGAAAIEFRDRIFQINNHPSHFWSIRLSVIDLWAVLDT